MKQVSTTCEELKNDMLTKEWTGSLLRIHLQSTQPIISYPNHKTKLNLLEKKGDINSSRAVLQIHNRDSKLNRDKMWEWNYLKRSRVIGNKIFGKGWQWNTDLKSTEREWETPSEKIDNLFSFFNIYHSEKMWRLTEDDWCRDTRKIIQFF